MSTQPFGDPINLEYLAYETYSVEAVLKDESSSCVTLKYESRDPIVEQLHLFLLIKQVTLDNFYLQDGCWCIDVTLIEFSS